MRKNHDIVEIDGILIKETGLALLIESGGVRGWCPKSETEDNNDGTFSMPEWLAKDKNFI